MALKIFEKFSPRANPADADYPYGSIKNESVPGAKDGTPLDASWGNDMLGFTDAILDEAGITPNGSPDTVQSSQRLDALKTVTRKPLELKIFQSPTDNLTKVTTFAGGVGVVYEVRKTSDNSLATIYSDKDGVTEIVQNGTTNVSNGDAEVVFYIAGGDYYIEVGILRSNFSTVNIENINRVFSTLDEALNYDGARVGLNVYLNEIEIGRGLSVNAVYVSGHVDNGMDTFNHSSLPIQLKFRARESKPQVAFMFDDAHVSHYTDVLPLFESYGFPLAFAICPRFTGEELNDTRMNTTQMLDAQKRGVEIINHSMSHANLSNVASLERAIAEIETSRQWLESRGLNNVGYLAASSALNQSYLSAVSARHAYGLTVFADNNVDVAGVKPSSNPYQLSRLTLEGVSATATIERIKESVKLGYSVMAYDHDVPNPSLAYTELEAVLNFVNDNSNLIEVALPRVLVSSILGSQDNIPHYKEERQIFNSTAGYLRTPNLGFGTQLSGVNKEITITPTSLGTGTVTRDIEVPPSSQFTFSCNIRSGSAQAQISMGVICLDSLGATIDGYTIETGKIDYDGNSQQRYGVEFHTPENCAEVRIFWRITPLVIDGTTLLIREPAIYTGRRVLFELLEEEAGFTFTEEVVNPNYTPDLSSGDVFFLRLDSSPATIENPIGTAVDGNSKITFYIRANGNNRDLKFGSEYRIDPNFNSNLNVTGQLIIISFRYYRGLWLQESLVDWLN